MPYYVKINGETIGPGTSDDLRRLAAAGELRGVLISKSPDGPWTPAEQIKGLGVAALPTPGPPKPPPKPVEVVGTQKDASPGTWRYYLRRAARQAVLAPVLGIIGGTAIFVANSFGNDGGAIGGVAAFVGGGLVLFGIAALLAALLNAICALYLFVMQV